MMRKVSKKVVAIVTACVMVAAMAVSVSAYHLRPGTSIPCGTELSERVVNYTEAYAGSCQPGCAMYEWQKTTNYYCSYCGYNYSTVSTGIRHVHN
jgi:hypothetical protein